MKKMMMGWMAVGMIGGAVTAEAHLINGSLSVKSGEKFKAGEVVQVKWSVDNAHDPFDFDILFSTNGGSSFEKVVTRNFTGTGAKTYAWTVPNSPATTARIKVCQWDRSNSCAYSLTSPNFTIETSTAIGASKDVTENALRFNPASGNLDVSFRLDREDAVTLTAFDAQGKVAVILLDGRYGAGDHTLSVFSTRLKSVGKFVFQLKVGGKVSKLEPANLR